MQTGIAEVMGFDVEPLSPKQEHIVRSTYEAMGDRGLANLSLQDMADAAGVKKTMLPYYFSSKENLIFTTMRWVLVRVAERIREAIDEADSARGQISAMLDVVFYKAEANRRAYLVFFDFLNYAARNDRFGEMSATFRDVINGLYTEVIRIGQKEGAFEVADAEEGASVMRAIVDGLFIQWLQEKDWEKSHSAYRVLCERAVLGYLDQGDKQGIQ